MDAIFTAASSNELKSQATEVSMFLSLLPMAHEVYLFVFFCMGFYMFRCDWVQRYLRVSNRHGRTSLQQKVVAREEKIVDTRGYTLEQLWSDFKYNRHSRVVQGWSQISVETCTIESLCMVVQAFLAIGRAQEIGSLLLRAVRTWPKQLKTSLREAVETAAAPEVEVEQQDVAVALRSICSDCLDELDADATEALMLALARCNDDSRVASLLRRLAKMGSPAHSSILAAITQSFLACGNAAEALKYLQCCFASDSECSLNDMVPPRLVVSIVHAVTDASVSEETGIRPRAWDAFEIIENIKGVPAEVLVLLAQWAAQQSPPDEAMATRVGKKMKSAEFDDHRANLSAAYAALIRVYAAAGCNEKVCDACESSEFASVECDDDLVDVISKSALHIGRHQTARQFLGKGRRNVQSYINVMRACSQAGDIDAVKQTFQQLRDHKGADTSAYNCMLDSLVSHGDTDGAQKLFEEMRALTLTDAASCSILFKSQVRSDDSPVGSDAEAMLDEMREQGVRPSSSTYNAIISSALTTGDLERAWQNVAQLEVCGGVDAYTVSILFKGQKKERQAMGADAFDKTLGLIERNSVKIDEIMINAALEACVAMRDARRLAACLTLFNRRGWAVPNQCGLVTYGLLIKAYGQQKQIGWTWKLWTEVTQERGIAPSEQLYGQMIDALVVNDRLDDALALLQEMRLNFGDRLESQGFSVAFAVIIRGYAQKRDCGRALECYEEMNCHNMKVGLVIFNTLIDACCRVGDMDSAARLFRDMMEADCLPDLITYSTLIKGYCGRGELEEAMELFALMRNKGITPDAIVFNSLLDGCAKQQRINLCEKVFEDMIAAGIAPSNYSASILIKLYGRCHNVDAAFQVLEELPVKYGFRANIATYTCLMTTCIANGQLNKAMCLLTRMAQDGVAPDDRTYSTLLRGALKTNHVENSLTILRTVLTRGDARLLDAELVANVISMMRRKRGPDPSVEEMSQQLRQAGLSAHSSPQASYQHGRRADVGSRCGQSFANKSQAQRSMVGGY